MTPPRHGPRRSPHRLAVLRGIVASTADGLPYPYAAAIDRPYAQALLDGGFIEIREAPRPLTGGTAHHIYATDEGRALLARWNRAVLS